jgi:hypothetical protein
MDQAQGMAQLIMDDWKRFFRTHGVPLQGVCRAVRSALTPQPEPQPVTPVRQDPTQVERLSARVAELEAELARLRAESE